MAVTFHLSHRNWPECFDAAAVLLRVTVCCSIDFTSRPPCKQLLPARAAACVRVCARVCGRFVSVCFVFNVLLAVLGAQG